MIKNAPKSSDPVIRWLDRLIKLLFGYVAVVIVVVVLSWYLTQQSLCLIQNGMRIAINYVARSSFALNTEIFVKNVPLRAIFNNCVNVRMSGEPMYSVSCTNHGVLTSAADKVDMPSQIECSLRNGLRY
jgi:hypothetical protein